MVVVPPDTDIERQFDGPCGQRRPDGVLCLPPQPMALEEQLHFAGPEETVIGPTGP